MLVSLSSIASIRPRPCNRCSSKPVNDPVPGPNSTTVSPGTTSQLSTTSFDNLEELGQNAPTFKGSRMNASTNRHADVNRDSAATLDLLLIVFSLINAGTKRRSPS